MGFCMRVECPQCKTPYRLDEAKIKPEGSRVRCRKCKFVFRVHSEPAPSKPAPPSFSPAQAPSNDPPLERTEIFFRSPAAGSKDPTAQEEVLEKTEFLEKRSRTSTTSGIEVEDQDSEISISTIRYKPQANDLEGSVSPSSFNKSDMEAFEKHFLSDFSPPPQPKSSSKSPAGAAERQTIPGSSPKGPFAPPTVPASPNDELPSLSKKSKEEAGEPWNESQKPFGEETFLFKKPPIIAPKRSPRGPVIWKKAFVFAVITVFLLITTLMIIKQVYISDGSDASKAPARAETNPQEVAAKQNPQSPQQPMSRKQQLRYDRGKEFFYKFDMDSFERANVFFEEALHDGPHPILLAAAAKNYLYWSVLTKDSAKIILALDYLHQARDLSPHNEEVIQALAYYQLVHNHRLDLGREYLDQLKDKSNFETLYLEAAYYFKKDNLESAVSLARQAIDKNPEFVLAHQLIIEVSRQKSQAVNSADVTRSKKFLEQHAISQIHDFIDILPQRPPGLKTDGIDERPRKDAKQRAALPKPSDALVDTLTKEQENRDLARTLHAKGEEYLRNGSVENALQAFNQAISLDPEWPPPHKSLGMAYVRKRDTSNAIRSFKAFLSLATSKTDRSEVERLLKTLQ